MIFEVAKQDQITHIATASKGTAREANEGNQMLIKTKRFELEYHHRGSLYFEVNLKRGQWSTFRDLTGQGLSATSWVPSAQRG